ncbi:hypothetical protein [Candidatus Paracaedibacter symbiosus]|uniref:hypothetical protein n=1 Tax=Candidatus Paracaedibacter symbiosus TaxID=244582 RepID=UPI000509BAA9|nr:hypothetical protein [Candidatus Paracaedibacter symbiosus]
MHHCQLFFALSFLMTASGVMASGNGQNSTKWNIGARIGTLGVQGEVGYRFNKTFGLRFQAGGFIHNRETFEFGGISYHDVEIKPQTYNLIADWYLLNDAGFKLSIGGGYNRSKLVLNRDFSGISEVPFNGNVVPGTTIGILKACYHFRRFTPYFGAGYDSRNLFGSNFSLSLDVGAYVQGNTKAKISATGPIQYNPAGMVKLKQGAEEVVNDTWWIKTYPVISVAVRYNF